MKTIGIFGRKGGTGKSLITTLLASYINYSRRKRVLVIDLDSQKSIGKLREREKKYLKDNSDSLFFQAVSTQDATIYPIISLDFSELDSYLSKEYDYILCDFPGAIDAPGCITQAAKMDFILAPIINDKTVLESTIPLLDVFVNSNIQYPENKIILLWNLVAHMESQDGYLRHEKKIKEILPLARIVGKVFLSTYLKREVGEMNIPLKTTLLSPLEALKNINTKIKELETILQQIYIKTNDE